VPVYIISSLQCEDKRDAGFSPVKYWEIIADNLSKAGWNCGCISSTGQDGRQFWVVAAERQDTGRCIVHADKVLTAFLELHAAIYCRFELE
jgi:hypothetical protein